MPRRCTVCHHAERQAIDQALASQSTPFRRIAARFAVTEQAVRRHRADHLPAQLAKGAEAGRVADAGSLLEQVERLRDRALAIHDRAEQAGELRTALAAIREARSCVETLLEVERERRYDSSASQRLATFHLIEVGRITPEIAGAALSLRRLLRAGDDDATEVAFSEVRAGRVSERSETE